MRKFIKIFCLSVVVVVVSLLDSYGDKIEISGSFAVGCLLVLFFTSLFDLLEQKINGASSGEYWYLMTWGSHGLNFHSRYVGLKTKNVQPGEYEKAARHFELPKESVLIGFSYMGRMSKSEFEKKNHIEYAYSVKSSDKLL